MKVFGLILIVSAWGLMCTGVYLSAGIGFACITGGAGLWLELNLPVLLKAKK